MGRKTRRVDFFVRVWPRDPGDFGCVKLGGVPARTESEEEQLCQQIKASIKRHVADVGTVGVECTTETFCEFCGAKWTEGDSPHNGGCCDDDCAVMDSMEDDSVC